MVFDLFLIVISMLPMSYLKKKKLSPSGKAEKHAHVKKHHTVPPPSYSPPKGDVPLD